MTHVPPTTNNAGAPVASDAHSLAVGADGPIVLHDHYLVEKLAQFNRERVPERVVHAKGGGAFGTFTVTHDVSAYTRAALFQPGTTTDMLARFSSVAGEHGSPDTWRDPRGFALKFYTSEGNYDLVGNNTPVFFLRDGIKFPDFIRSQKRLPGSNLRDNDMQWDFWSLSPESAHQVTWLMGDRGLPRSWRTMDGFGSHTYQWVNAAGERFWVKYHFQTQQGIDNLTADEAAQLAGSDADHHIRDLHEHIADGQFPRWTLRVQVMPYEDAKSYRFNPFDLTKVWPHADYPLIEVGVMELNRNPENYFAQIEQATFAPSSFVPGIGPSPDKMLLARIFSYADAHRYRVGTNHAQLPVNAPQAPVHSYSKDGAARYDFAPADRPVYAPNSLGGPAADPARAGESGGWESDGEMVRAAATPHPEDDDWGQAGTLYREVFDDAARARFLETITGHVGGVKSDVIRARAVQYWTNVDAGLGAALAAALAAAGAPVEAGEPGTASVPVA
ncbi:catalase [Cellulomonas oligotrophica]|uniref:Catalase n=1 Tax=Cellulomonas oligotrophica TaxID=931536 RepID=A0A7Y9FC88_9CELL|nr:catalase [Cellulomonas oligotrophica]NYD84479.1 catalase [Cellulomonas oligotrophica]GIG33879.1 catalase [Cellulomonas oligotrophica]